MGCALYTLKYGEDEDIHVRHANQAAKSSIGISDELQQSGLHSKILILGTSEDGKTTIVNQLKFIGNGRATLSPNLLHFYQRNLRRNCIAALQELVVAAERLKIPFESEAIRAIALEASQVTDEVVFTPHFAEKMTALWNSSCIQETFRRKSEFWCLDSTEYLLQEIERFSREDFQPTIEDVVRLRAKTTRMYASKLVDQQYMYYIVDVGGQRKFREQWLEQYINTNALIYVASLSGYAQVLHEDKYVNRLHESLSVFEEVVINPVLSSVPIILFLNKKDVFSLLIKKNSLRNCFSEYDGPVGEYEPALNFIISKFASLVDRHCPQRPFQVKVLSAIDRRETEIAFQLVTGYLKNQRNSKASTETDCAQLTIKTAETSESFTVEKC